MPAGYKMFRRPVNRAMASNGRKIMPLGGAIPAVQKRYVLGQVASDKGEFPLMASLIYQPPSIVHTPVEVLEWAQPGGMVDRLYQPAQEKPRTFGEKIQSWFKSGRFE